MRILVLGAGGMAGHAIALYLRQVGHEVITQSNRHPLDAQTQLIDATDRDCFVGLLGSAAFDLVVNCIGILVDPSTIRKDLASYLNAYIPHLLEHFYAATNTRVIQISTDCVFSGLTGPYREDTPHDGASFYDRSKGLGELTNGKDLTLRMSIIGPDRISSATGLLNWFLQQHGDIPGYTSAIWNGITTMELSKGIATAINQDLTGVYHLVQPVSISKYELLKLLKSAFQLADVNIVPVKGPTTNKTLVNTRTDFDFEVPRYKSMVDDMKAWILRNRTQYPHYARVLRHTN